MATAQAPAPRPAAHHGSAAAPQPVAKSPPAEAPAGAGTAAGGLQAGNEQGLSAPAAATDGATTTLGTTQTDRFAGMSTGATSTIAQTPGQVASGPAPHFSAGPLATGAIGLLLFAGVAWSIFLTLRLSRKVTKLAQQLEGLGGAGLSSLTRTQTTEITTFVQNKHKELVKLLQQLSTGAPIKGGSDVEPVTAARSTAPRGLTEATAPGITSAIRGSRIVEPMPDDVLKGLDLGDEPARSSQSGRGEVLAAAALREPEPIAPPGLSDNELLSEVQKLAMDVFIDGRPASAEGLTKAILRRAAPPVARAISSGNLQVSAHSTAASLASEFQDPDFLSVTRADHTGWLIPNLRADYARTYVTLYEGETRNWPNFSDPALCTVDGSGRAKVTRRGRL